MTANPLPLSPPIQQTHPPPSQMFSPARVPTPYINIQLQQKGKTHLYSPSGLIVRLIVNLRKRHSAVRGRVDVLRRPRACSVGCQLYMASRSEGLMQDRSNLVGGRELWVAMWDCSDAAI